MVKPPQSLIAKNERLTVNLAKSNFPEAISLLYESLMKLNILLMSQSICLSGLEVSKYLLYICKRINCVWLNGQSMNCGQLRVLNVGINGFTVLL